MKLTKEQEAIAADAKYVVRSSALQRLFFRHDDGILIIDAAFCAF